MSRVLIVEDDEVLRAAVKRAVRGAGHRARDTGAMAGCPRLVADFGPQAVILDLNLPDTQGTETMEAMLGLVDHRVPIIVFSAVDIWADECLRLGAVEYLVKGEFTANDIPNAIKRAFARHRLARAINRGRDDDESWPGTADKDPDKVGDDLVSMAGELRLLAARG